MDQDNDTPGSGSPLSVIDSDEFQEDVKFHARSRSHSRDSTLSASSEGSASPTTSTPRHLGMRPAKRRKTGASAYDHATPQSGSTVIPPPSPTGSISSDTSGSVPTSPSFAHLGTTHPLYAAAQANPDNPELGDYVQVTRCLWTDCPTPEQGNMDNLVAHINDYHIVPRQKKYYCEWEGCNRKGQSHNSAYALKAHMRSHTKEKPFLCALPECDRSFTRSDALAKHMRTVHETEALRPSDPVPRGHTGGISNSGAAAANGPIKRIKLIMGGGANGEKKPSVIGDLPPLPTRYSVAALGIKVEDVDMQGGAEGADELADAVDVDSVPFKLPIPPDYYPADVWEGMDDFERGLPPSQYFRLLRRQIHWAEQEGRELAKELEEERAATDDVRGHVIKRGSGDEKSGDENRRLEWQRTEEVLDAVLRAEATQVLEMFTGKKDAGSNQNPWTMIKGLDGLAGTPEVL